MFTQKLLEFKQRHNIPSADKWADVSGVSKSTIIRALKGDCKDMKVYTLDALLKPYGGSIDELLGIGNYSPEAIEKEELKNEIVEKIETVIDVIENSEELPEQPTEEIKTALVEVQDYIANESTEHTKCVGCDTLREMIMELKKDKASKDKWLTNLFALSAGMLVALSIVLIVFSIIVINMSNALH